MPTTQDSVLEIHSGLVLKGQLSMVKDVILTGKFEGDLQTQGCLTVSPGGAATGTIEAAALILEPGNQVEARVKIGSPAPVVARTTAAQKPGGKWPQRLKKWKEMALGRSPS